VGTPQGKEKGNRVDEEDDTDLTIERSNQDTRGGELGRIVNEGGGKSGLKRWEQGTAGPTQKGGEGGGFERKGNVVAVVQTTGKPREVGVLASEMQNIKTDWTNTR